MLAENSITVVNVKKFFDRPPRVVIPRSPMAHVESKLGFERSRMDRPNATSLSLSLLWAAI